MTDIIEPRHEFYETDEKVIVSIFDKGAVADEVSVNFSSRSVIYKHAKKELILQPLAGEIDPANSNFAVGKVKVEVRLGKKTSGRWQKLVGSDAPAMDSFVASTAPTRNARKNWEGIAEDAIKSQPEKTLTDDPNAGGDAALNGFFQQLYKDADDDTKRAMMKSFQESGGTTLSTNWGEVEKKKMDVNPPEGGEWKKWG